MLLNAFSGRIFHQVPEFFNDLRSTFHCLKLINIGYECYPVEINHLAALHFDMQLHFLH